MGDLSAADLIRALGLALILEGVLYAAFPDTMRQMLMQALQAPRDAFRLGALLTAVAGLALLVVAGS